MRMQLMIEALAQSVEKAGSTDAGAIAAQMERAVVSLAGRQGLMRASDHQFQQPLEVALMGKQGTLGVAFDVEGSGYGFAVVKSIPAARAEQASSCKMIRP
jgi:branched-chain amino acid transport system substrate-binding protein